MLIGLSAALLLILNGRVAGISGIAGRLAKGTEISTNTAFAAGLVAGPLLYLAAFGTWPTSTLTPSRIVLISAGLF
jgi:uncharacterized membrane protein YedE/YeeE